MSSFVYENVEVKKTGRQATRQLSSAKVETIVEITPVNDRDGVWHKWVPERVLFIVDTLEEDRPDRPGGEE